MAKLTKELGVTEAKAHFLTVVTEVERKGNPVTITRNGRKVARIVPMAEEDPLARYRIGGVTILGDIESPANDPEDWEYD